MTTGTQVQITERKAQGHMERAERRAEYISVAYIEPSEGNEAAVGFDVASDPTRLKAIERSRDTGEMIATARIMLVQETEEAFGTLILKPVYESGAAHDTVEQRRQNLAGFAVGVLRIDDMVEASADSVHGETVNIQLVDDGSPAGERLLYVWQASPGRGPTQAQELDASDTTILRAPLEMPGREWSLLISPAHGFLNAHASWESWGVLAGGLLVTALLVAYIVSVKKHAANVERLAAKLTESNEDLEREMAERTLTVEENRRLALAVANASDGVFVTGMDGLITFVNRAEEKMLGYAPGEMLGMQVLDIHAGSLGETTGPEIFEATRREGSWTGEVPVPNKSGEELHVMLSTALIRDDEGQALGTVGIATDVTRRRRSDRAMQEFAAKVEQRNQDLEHFAWFAAHDLQEPVRKIQMFADRLMYQDREPLSDQGQDYLQRMRGAAERMRTLIDNLLQYSRITTRAEPFALVDLGKVARQSVGDLKEQITRVGGRVEVRSLPVLGADAVQMGQLEVTSIGV